MNTGILTHAKNFLVANWKAHDVTTGNIPVKGLDFRGEVIVPGNRVQQLKAFKGIVYACVDLRAIGVSNTQLRVYKTKQSRAKSHWRYLHTRDLTDKRQDEIIAKAPLGSSISRAESVEEVLNGPYVKLLHTVNDYMNLIDLMMLTSTYEDLIGDNYWILVRNMLKMPVNIWVAPAEFMKPIADGNVFISGYVYKAGTPHEIKFPKEDVVHFKHVSPHNPYVGMAPLAAVADAYNLREYMVNFEKEMFRTGGNPKLIMLSKDPISKQEGEMLKDKYTHTDAAGIAVMGGQDFEFFQPQTINARDMGYREGIAWTRDEIASAYHVPKSMLTSDGIVTSTAILAQDLFLAKYATSPSVTAKAQKMNEQLSWQMTAGDNEQFVLFDDPVPENREELRADLEMQIKNGIITRAEARALLMLEPLEGTDELLVPNDLIPIDQVGQEPDDDEMVSQTLSLMAKVRESKRGA